MAWANWTFVIWGLCHGIIIVFEKYLSRFFKKSLKWNVVNKQSLIIKLLSILYTNLAVYFTFIIFRASDIHDAFLIIRKCITVSIKDMTIFNIL